MERMRDPYLYPDTEVLKNKFGVMDNETLKYHRSRIYKHKAKGNNGESH